MVETGGYFAFGPAAESLRQLKEGMEAAIKQPNMVDPAEMTARVEGKPEPSIVALIPARAGSKRIKDKNIRDLGGKPLIAWTIEAAKGSGIFARIIVCTDSDEYARIAGEYGAELLKRSVSADDEPDIAWVKQAAPWLTDAFAILRPTSPFRTADTIRRAWWHFLDHQPCDSLRAVEPVKQHPGKMWVERGNRLLPLLPWQTEQAPWHSSPTQSLPPVWMQNASLEIAWTKTVTESCTIAGANVLPWEMPEGENLDLNTPEDWQRAEEIIARGLYANS